jgi:hypothetical protein
MSLHPLFPLNLYPLATPCHSVFLPGLCSLLLWVHAWFLTFFSYSCLIRVMLLYALFPFFHWLSFASVSRANHLPFLSQFSFQSCSPFLVKRNIIYWKTFWLRLLCSLFYAASSAALRFHIVSEDAGIEPRTVTLAFRCSNHSAGSHPRDITADAARGFLAL